MLGQAYVRQGKRTRRIGAWLRRRRVLHFSHQSRSTFRRSSRRSAIRSARAEDYSREIISLTRRFPDKTKPMPSAPSSDVKFEIGHVLFIDIVGYSKLLINQQSEQLER